MTHDSASTPELELLTCLVYIRVKVFIGRRVLSERYILGGHRVLYGRCVLPTKGNPTYLKSVILSYAINLVLRHTLVPRCLMRNESSTNQMCLFLYKQVLYKLAYTESCKRDMASECAKR